MLCFKFKIGWLRILAIGVLICGCSAKNNETISMGRYFSHDEFAQNFGKEMVSAEDIYKSFKKNGLKDNALGAFDIVYISDTKEKLDSLGNF